MIVARVRVVCVCVFVSSCVCTITLQNDIRACGTIHTIGTNMQHRQKSGGRVGVCVLRHAWMDQVSALRTYATQQHAVGGGCFTSARGTAAQR